MKNNNYGNCVAGIGEQGEWVRLVSAADGDSLPDATCKAFGCLDIIDVDVTPCPIKNHPENVKLEQYNGKIGRCTIEDVVERYGVDREQFCFINSNPALSESERQSIEKSLMRIRVQDLEVYKDDINSSKAQFIYNGTHYDSISVTDNFHKKPKKYGDAYIVASLPAETGGFSGYYKFIAAIYPI